MSQFLNRFIDNTLGRIADTMLRCWDSRSLRRPRRHVTRLFTHRRAVIRDLERRMRAATLWQRCWLIPLLTVIACARGLLACGRGFHRASRILALLISRAQRSRFVRQFKTGARALGRIILRCVHAQAEAWRWLGRMALRPFQGRATDAAAIGTAKKRKLVADIAPTNATMPDGVMALMSCAACGHEVMGTNMKKYFKFRCPRCRASLLVIDAPKGLSMQVVASDRRQATRIEKTETEESEPVRL